MEAQHHKYPVVRNKRVKVRTYWRQMKQILLASEKDVCETEVGSEVIKEKSQFIERKGFDVHTQTSQSQSSISATHYRVC